MSVANAIGYEKQNSYINTQLSYLQKSYAKQIEIAKLSKDTTEQSRLQAEYEAKKVELQRQQIDNIKTDYENKIGFINNGKQDVDNTLAETEARGDIVRASFYSSLNSYENKVLAELKSELVKLNEQQSKFDKYSQEWYDLQSDIQSVENTISETNQSIIENNKKIGELRETMYEDIASRNSDISSEAQFLAGLLGENLTDDKAGKLTGEGLGVLGTYGIELVSNKSTAGSYKQEREEIEKAIAAFNSGDAHALDIYGSLTAAKKELNEIIKKQQEATTAEYDSKKKIYDLMVQLYDTQLAYMKSILDAKKQVLDMEKDLYDYEKNISSQTKNIASLEKQMAALKGDDSEEGRAKQAKLQVSFDEANEQLQDTEYERYISDQQNMMDNMYNQYEDLLTALEKDFETVVNDGIQLINTTAGGITDTLNNIAEKYDYVTTEDMRGIMDSFKESGLTDLQTAFKTVMNGIEADYNNGNTNISNTENTGSGSPSNNTTTFSSVQGATPDRNAVIEQGYKDEVELFLAKYSGKGDKTKPLRPVVNGETFSSDLNKKLAQFGYIVKSGTGAGGMQYINMFAQSLGLMSGDSSFKSGGTVYKAIQKKYPNAGFRTGGIVRVNGMPKDGDNVPVRVNPDETILTQEFTEILPEAVDKMEGFVTLSTSDIIKLFQEKSNIGNTNGFVNTMIDVNRNMNLPVSDIIKTPDYTKLAEVRNDNGTANNFGDIVINAELPNVKDGNSFISEIQNKVRSQRFFERCVYDCVKSGKLTHNIQRF